MPKEKYMGTRQKSGLYFCVRNAYLRMPPLRIQPLVESGFHSILQPGEEVETVMRLYREVWNWKSLPA